MTFKPRGRTTDAPNAGPTSTVNRWREERSPTQKPDCWWCGLKIIGKPITLNNGKRLRPKFCSPHCIESWIETDQSNKEAAIRNAPKRFKVPR